MKINTFSIGCTALTTHNVKFQIISTPAKYLIIDCIIAYDKHCRGMRSWHNIEVNISETVYINSIKN